MNLRVDMFSSLAPREEDSIPVEMTWELHEAIEDVAAMGGGAEDLRAAADRVWIKWGRLHG